MKRYYTTIKYSILIFMVTVCVLLFLNKGDYDKYNIKYHTVSKATCTQIDGPEISVLTYLISQEGSGYNELSNSISIVARKNGFDYEIFRGVDDSNGTISISCNINDISIYFYGVFPVTKYETKFDNFRIRYDADNCASDPECSSEEARKFLGKIDKLHELGKIDNSQYEIYTRSAKWSINQSRSFSNWIKSVNKDK